MPVRLAPLLLLLAASSLGCAGSPGARGGAAEAGASGSAAGGDGRADERMCMYDRASGRLRTCLHFSFGRCALFGDPCSKHH